jgi:hypothetical protein
VEKIHAPIFRNDTMLKTLHQMCTPFVILGYYTMFLMPVIMTGKYKNGIEPVSGPKLTYSFEESATFL